MIIIGVDPGKTTGVALLNTDVRRSLVNQVPANDAVDICWGFIECDEHKPHVVCERFVITPNTHRMTRQHDALEIIGALRHMCLRHDRTFQLEPPSVVKVFADNATLRGLNLYTPKCEHGNDAMRHALFYASIRLGLADAMEPWNANG